MSMMAFMPFDLGRTDSPDSFEALVYLSVYIFGSVAVRQCQIVPGRRLMRPEIRA